MLRRYGAKCALCDIEFPELVDAVHIYPRSEAGTDDPRNDLILCALHHRAFDRELFVIEPSSLRIQFRDEGPYADDLMIKHERINHLTLLPHDAALSWCWDRWKKLET